MSNEMLDIFRTLEIEGKIHWDAFKYLEVLISKDSPKLYNWLPLIDKLKVKINTRGSSCLNPTAKVMLIKAVLTSIPIYQCSILLALKGITAQIEGLIRCFLWKGGKHNEKNFYW